MKALVVHQEQAKQLMREIVAVEQELLPLQRRLRELNDTLSKLMAGEYTAEAAARSDGPSIRERALAMLDANPTRVYSAPEAALAVGDDVKVPTMRVTLLRLFQDGGVQRVSHGAYASRAYKAAPLFSQEAAHAHGHADVGA